jgi:predicted phosphodiesterase
MAILVLILVGLIGIVMVLKQKPVVRSDVVVVNEEIEVPTKTADQGIKFGVMADVHMDWTDWKKFLETSKARSEQFVVIAGDMTSLGKTNELLAAKKILDDSGMKYYVVPGNHDLWMSLKTKSPLFNEVFGKDYQSFRYEQVKFILVNNGDAAGLGKMQMEWLEGEVKECKVITCLVVMHMPLNNAFSGHVMGEGSTLVTNEAASLIKLFRDNGVKETITGHLHYSTSYELEGIRTTIVGAVNRDRNNQTPRYTEFMIANKNLDWEVVEE